MVREQERMNRLFHFPRGLTEHNFGEILLALPEEDLDKVEGTLLDTFKESCPEGTGFSATG